MASQPGWPLVPDAAALAADELRDARVFTVNDRQVSVS